MDTNKEELPHEQKLFYLGGRLVTRLGSDYSIKGLIPYGTYSYIGDPVHVEEADDFICVARLKKVNNSSSKKFNSNKACTGYINSEGKVIIPFEFDWGSPFTSDGYAAVLYDKQYHIINHYGDLAIDEVFDDACSCMDKMRVRKGNKLGTFKNGIITWDSTKIQK